MSFDWMSLIGGCLLLMGNCIAWLSLFYGLPGNWIILANCLLADLLLSGRSEGSGIGIVTLVILGVLCLLGEGLTRWVVQAKLGPEQLGMPIVRRTVMIAGLGGILGALPGLVIPVFGLLLSIAGAIGGATFGAVLGHDWGLRRSQTVPPTFREQQLAPLLLRIVRIAPSLLIGLIMLFITLWSPFS